MRGRAGLRVYSGGLAASPREPWIWPAPALASHNSRRGTLLATIAMNGRGRGGAILVLWWRVEVRGITGLRSETWGTQILVVQTLAAGPISSMRLPFQMSAMNASPFLRRRFS